MYSLYTIQKYSKLALNIYIHSISNSISKRYTVWVGVVVEYRTRNRTERLRVRLTPGPLQATFSKLLTYCVLRPTQHHTLSGTENE